MNLGNFPPTTLAIMYSSIYCTKMDATNDRAAIRAALANCVGDEDAAEYIRLATHNDLAICHNVIPKK